MATDQETEARKGRKAMGNDCTSTGRQNKHNQIALVALVAFATTLTLV